MMSSGRLMFDGVLGGAPRVASTGPREDGAHIDGHGREPSTQVSHGRAGTTVKDFTEVLEDDVGLWKGFPPIDLGAELEVLEANVGITARTDDNPLEAEVLQEPPGTLEAREDPTSGCHIFLRNKMMFW